MGPRATLNLLSGRGDRPGGQLVEQILAADTSPPIHFQGELLEKVSVL